MRLPVQRHRGAYGLALLAALGLAWYWPGAEPERAPPAPAAAGSWSQPVGPGRAGSGPGPALELAVDDLVPPGGLEVDAGGQLVANHALRMVMDFFLARGEGADLATRAGQLRLHLGRQLSGTAWAQGQALADQYLNYVRAHDDLLARQRFAPRAGAAPGIQELERLAVWQEQRARLRQSWFAPALLQSWFGDEDGQLAQALAELRERASAMAVGGAEGEPEADSNTWRERRLHGATQEAARAGEIEELLAGATTSYEAAAAAERQWRAHYGRYRDAMAQVGAGIQGEARRHQADALQASIFTSEAERIRARASGIE